MIIIPAIDLIGGKCVRLIQGDYAREKTYDEDPGKRAQMWESGGANIIHIVDLEGAKDGQRHNLEAIATIRKAVSCQLEVGGGLRSIEDAEYLLSLGVDRVILGTMAVRDPVPVEFLAGKYPGRIIVGADGRNSKVALQGWQTTNDTDIFEFGASFNHLPLAGILFTDIDTDGMLAGPNIEAQRKMGEAITNPLIASGGISSLADIRLLQEAAIPNLFGVVVGTALYEKKFSLAEAVAEVADAG